MARYSEEGLRAPSLLDITHADYREANWGERRRRKRYGVARSEFGSYWIPRRRKSLAAIHRVLAFSAIRRRCACSDITIPPNCSGETCARWNITRGRTEGRIQAAVQQADGVVDGTKVPLKIPDLHPNTLRHRMSSSAFSAPPTASRDSFHNASPTPTKCGGPSILCGRSPAQN